MRNQIKAILSFTLVLSALIFNSNHTKAEGFNSISGTDALVIVVGNNGAIYRSGNGGITFASRSSGTVNYNSVCIKGINVWIAGDNGNLVLSTNAGSSFVTNNISSENLKSVYFIDNLNGWISCSGGKILRSTNGGSTWTQQTSPVTTELNFIKFINATTGVAGGGSTMLITTNGGAQWNISPIPANKNILSFDVSGYTIIAGCKDGLVIKSTNLGSSWNVIDYKILTKSDVNGISMIDSNKYMSCGVGGFIRKSTDGGNTFTYQPNSAWIDLSSIFFFSELRGWAISNTSNVVLRTTDGGLNWSVPNGTSISLSWELKIPLSIFSTSGNVFYQSTWNKKEIFVTKANLIYRSLDIGDTWQQIGNPIPNVTNSNSFCISSKDSNIFLVSTDSLNSTSAWAYRSTDYGQTWSISLSGQRSADGTPFSLDPSHPDTIYYGMMDTNLFRSTNFGASWSPVGTFHFENVCYVKVPEDRSNIILVGGRGTSGTVNFANVVRSSDYGLTWEVVDSTSGTGIPELPVLASSSLNSTLYSGVYEGDFGGLKRSTNSGLSWSNINFDEYIWGMDVAKDDPNTLVYSDLGGVTGNSGLISYDKGLHFTPLPQTISSGTFAVYAYNRKTIFLQQLGGFYKLNVSVNNPLGIQPISTIIPDNFSLHQNYPNPFNPKTKIKFEVARQSLVKMSIFNIAGREISNPVNTNLNAGTYEVDFDGSHLSSGTYFYRIVAGNYVETRKMILLK